MALDSFGRFIIRYEFGDEQDKTCCFRLSFFSHLDDETLSRLADTVEENFFDEHDHVVRHGAHGSQFYIVKKGQVCHSVLFALSPLGP